VSFYKTLKIHVSVIHQTNVVAPPTVAISLVPGDQHVILTWERPSSPVPALPAGQGASIIYIIEETIQTDPSIFTSSRIIGLVSTE